MVHSKHESIKDMVYAGIIGHAVGDALGVPVESLSRLQLASRPIRDMMGFGSISFRLVLGLTIPQWKLH